MKIKSSESEKQLKSSKSEITKLKIENKNCKSNDITLPASNKGEHLAMALLDSRLKLVEEKTKSMEKDLSGIVKSSSKWEKSSGDCSNLSKTIQVH